MKPREVIDRTTTPDGERMELAIESGHHVIRIDGIPLMSSATYGSEQAMARVAAELLRKKKASAEVLIGGLGMGFTLRAALDCLGAGASVTVAELLPTLVEYNRGPLADLAGKPLDDPRAHLFEGDVQVALVRQEWDAVLLDVDNGPDAFTTAANASIYDDNGLATIESVLKPGGVLVVWSAYASRSFEKRLRRAGFAAETRSVRARGELNKGPVHTLFIGRKRAPGSDRRRGGPKRRRDR